MNAADVRVFVGSPVIAQRFATGDRRIHGIIEGQHVFIVFGNVSEMADLDHAEGKSDACKGAEHVRDRLFFGAAL